MEKIYEVAIVIINYNGNLDTLECLNSIDNYCKKNNYTVLLLDNGSRNPILEEELSRFTVPIRYIQSVNNLGFAGGNNLAISKLEGKKIDFALLLNNDTVFVDDSVDKLIKVIAENKDVIGGIVNFYYDSPNEMWQAGSYVRASRLASKEEKNFSLLSNKLVFVDSIPGSSMIIPWKIIEDVGLFDERYFAYFEELDFCLRAKEHGYRVAFLPNTRILHKVGRSSTNKLKHYLRSRNTLLFYSLHYKQYMFIAYLRVVLRTVRNTLRCKFRVNYFVPLLKGITDYQQGVFHEGNIAMFK